MKPEEEMTEKDCAVRYLKEAMRESDIRQPAQLIGAIDYYIRATIREQVIQKAMQP